MGRSCTSGSYQPQTTLERISGLKNRAAWLNDAREEVLSEIAELEATLGTQDATVTAQPLAIEGEVNG